jgi:hypothetical protein
MTAPTARGNARRPRLLVGAATAVLLLVLGLVLGLRPGDGDHGCRVSSTGSATCGLWWGGALTATNSALPAAVATQQQATGRRLDIVHTYHRWYDDFPTASERALAGTGHLLLLNWEPVDQQGGLMPWASIAAGAQDAQINDLAARLRTLPEVLVSFSHEPELKWPKHGGTADFVAAFRHVHDLMEADGAHNVSWVWDMMGLDNPSWLARYPQLWPGNSYVDWVAWDPYNSAGCEPDHQWLSFAQTVGPLYRWLEAHGFGDKPFMLAEYGTVEKPGDPAGKADWYAGIPSALSALPNLRALVYFDIGAPPANCNWQISTSAISARAFAGLARSQPFRGTATLDIGAH